MKLKNSSSIQLTIGEVESLVSNLVDLYTAIDSSSKEELIYDKFKEQRRRVHLLLKEIRRISIPDFFPENAIGGFDGFLFLLNCRYRKRKSYKYIRGVKRSLKKAAKAFGKKKSKKACKLLERSFRFGRRGLHYLRKLECKINTELNTAKTVQIQIQQEK